MSGLILPSRFNQQPQHAAPIDLGNPITRGLTLASIGSEGSVRRNVVTGGTAVETSTTRTTTSVGRVFTYPAGAGSNFGNTPVVSGTDQTIIVWSNPPADASQRPFFSDRNVEQLTFAANAEPAGFTASSGQLCLIVVTGGVTRGFGATGAVDGNAHIYAVSRSGATGQFYVDGIPVTTTVSGTPGSLAIATHIAKLGRHDGTGLSLRADLGFVLVWNRQLSDAEVAAISANPWQVFKAPTRRLWAPTAGGGGSDVTVALTGEATAASAGTLTTATEKTLTGEASTGAQGTTVPTSTVSLSSQEASAAQGSMGVAGDVTVALSGQAMEITQGLLTRLTASTAEYSGGFFEVPQVPRRRTIKEDRERLGIIPKQVKQIVQAVARASVVAHKTDGEATYQLEQRLAKQDIEAKTRYAEFMKQERDRILSRDIERAMRIKRRQYEIDEDEREVEMLLM